MFFFVVCGINCCCHFCAAVQPVSWFLFLMSFFLLLVLIRFHMLSLLFLFGWTVTFSRASRCLHRMHKYSCFRLYVCSSSWLYFDGQKKNPASSLCVSFFFVISIYSQFTERCSRDTHFNMNVCVWVRGCANFFFLHRFFSLFSHCFFGLTLFWALFLVCIWMCCELRECVDSYLWQRLSVSVCVCVFVCLLKFRHAHRNSTRRVYRTADRPYLLVASAAAVYFLVVFFFFFFLFVLI